MKAITFFFDNAGKFTRSVQTAQLHPVSFLDISCIAVAAAHAELDRATCDCAGCRQARPMAKSLHELHGFFGEAIARQTHAGGAANGQ